MRTNMLRTAAAVLFGLLCWLPATAAGAEQPKKVTLLRVPGRGIQPQVVVDGKGIVHLIYFRGQPGNGDIFYSSSRDNGKTFARPLRVNSQPGSAIAIGNIRGAHLAIGKNGRPHVAWNGSGKAQPKGSGKYPAPMLYSRLNDAGTAFEPQRNLIRTESVLDGGGSVAADADGNVYVVWHSPAPGDQGEEKRRVWVVRSTDEGKTFGRAQAVNDKTTGVCGCCGLRAFTDRKGALFVLYRSANGGTNRDTYLLRSGKPGGGFNSDKIDPWKVDICPMSSYGFAEGAAGVVGAWESNFQVFFTRVNSTGKRSETVPAPGAGKGRKHPAVAVNAQGETILVWTEGMGWSRGGSLAWQVFDKDGSPTADRGRADGVPVWSLVAVFARPDGGFTIVY